ncbi:MAG: efflux RND transporter periplasmic adaptor subunit [Prevotella sp.]|nr:efflux RND transporter periplasmic adaptor subunit [Prevotella sp.]
MKKITTYLLTLLAAGALFSCSGKKAETAAPVDDGLIEITPEQFKSSHMRLGSMGSQTFRDRVECKGYVSAPANAMSKICPPIAGKIINIHYKIGDYVPAGRVIATISGNDFMALQQSFAESAAAYSKAKMDYERAQGLWAEKIGAQKDFLAAKTYYRSAYASYESLRSRITALGISPARIEGGKMYTSYPVMAPISGYLTQINAVIGQYIDVETDIAELVNLNALQLKVSVYEADVRRLRPGQTILFGTTGSNNRTLQARLTTIGKTVNPDTKMIDCVAAISKSNGVSLVNESFVEASIIIDARQAPALPVTAVQKQGTSSFVYVVEKRKGNSYMLRKTPVNVGQTDGSYIEIKTQLPNKDIVLEGIDTMK